MSTIIITSVSCVVVGCIIIIIIIIIILLFKNNSDGRDVSFLVMRLITAEDGLCFINKIVAFLVWWEGRVWIYKGHVLTFL